MQVYNYLNEAVSSPAPIRRVGLLLAATVFALSTLLITPSRADDMETYKDWPQQSRAERLGTFTYVFGGTGFISHSGTAEGAVAYGLNTDEPELAKEDADDIFITGGFGLRLSSDLNFEVGLSLLNGAYDAPSGTGPTPKPDQPAFEMSLLKGLDLGGPPLLRYTLRAGFASIDDPNTDDGAFFGFGVSHEPFRAEFRSYDFGTFESDVFSVSYIYDF